MSKRAASQEITQGVSEMLAPDASLEQIRSILFGAQVRDLEQKLSRLEARVQSDQGQMTQDFQSRIAGLEKDLLDRLEQESQERQIAEGSLQNALDKAVEDLEGRLAAEAKELRHELRDQGKDMGKKLEQTAARLEAAIAELRLQKTDRLALADLLGGVAEKLRKE